MSHSYTPQSSNFSTGSYRYRWLVFIAMLTGEVMDVLDMSILHVAGPALERELGATPAQLQWAIGGYALAMGASLVVAGRLGDVIGRRRLFMLALASFASTSLLCAISPTIGLLIAFRFLQGISGALMLPQGFALLRAVFKTDELGRALAVFGPIMGLATIVGPVLGGAIIAADIGGYGWRAALGLNVPLALVALLVVQWYAPKDPTTAWTAKVDWMGAVWVAASSGLLILPLIQGQEVGWPAWALLCLAFAAAGFIGFVMHQRRLARSGGTPLVEPSLFSKPAFSAGIAAMALFFSGFIGMQLVFTLFVQLGLGYSAAQAGMAALPLTIGCFIGAGVAGGFLLERIGARILQLGAVMQLVALGLLLGALSSKVFEVNLLTPGLLTMGIGGGMIISSLITIVISAVSEHEVGSGSGVLAAVQAMASSAGVAVLSGLFFGGLMEASAVNGYRLALMGQGVLLFIFLLVSFCLPVHTRIHSPAH